MIYFAQPTNGGPIRIGSSENTDARKRTMGTWIPGGVETVLEIEGGLLGEFVLHHCFNPVRVERDWFRSCAAIWEFIIDAKSRRPRWVPKYKGVAERVVYSEILDEFGDPSRSARILGFNSVASFEQSARFQCNNGFGLTSKIAFARLLRDGELPRYSSNTF